MNPVSAADDPPPTVAAAVAIPPNGEAFKAPPPGSTGCLIRRVPLDSGGYDLTKKEFKINAFFPSRDDNTGLSVNWEGPVPDFETAETLLSKAQGSKTRNTGGVIAVPFEAVIGSGLQVIRDDDDKSLWHCLIPELKRPIYETNRNSFIVYADKLLRAANDQPTRIPPRPVPPS